jgi:oxazoline/thiazoline synthase
MLARPRLKRSFRPIVLENGPLFLLSEHAELVFDGPAYVALAPLLDGTRTIGEVLAAAAPKAPWPTLYVALSQLEAKGCLVEGPALSDEGTAAFWDYLGVDGERAAAACAGTRLSVRAVGGLSEEPLRAGLLAAGLHVEGDGDLSVVASPDYLLPDLKAVNDQALARGRPWLLVKPVGTMIWVGPLFRPGATGCWQCLAARLRVNRQVEHYVTRRTGREEPAYVTRSHLESSERLGAAMAATELARALAAPEGESLEGKVLTFDLVRRELALHALVKRPQCPACGADRPGRPAEPRPIVLEPRSRAAEEVADREAAAADTYERYKHHVSPITGIVTWLIAQDPGTAGLTHNYSAGHYFPVTSDDLQALQQNIVSRSGGKGRTANQARTGALCEALERYSGIFWGDEPRMVASYEALDGNAVHIRDLALFSDAQYANRGATPALRDHHDVPPPLDERAAISWTPVWSLTRGRVRYLPTGYCYYGFHDPGAFFTRCDSNGCAAGATLEEAILYGFLELAERDSVALWWYNRIRRPAVDTASFALPYWDEMERYYRTELRRDLHALDLTADLGIPVFAVVSRRREREVEDVITGFAADLDPRAALLRALQEANQYLPSLRQESPDGSTLYRLYDEETIQWWKTATYANQPYLVPDPAAPPRRCADFRRLATGDLKEDVEACVGAAAKAGLETLVLDQTRPDVGLPVARVVVPGLRHFWRRLAPGRLYDVPVKLGWLERRLAEDELNPISCFV